MIATTPGGTQKARGRLIGARKIVWIALAALAVAISYPFANAAYQKRSAAGIQSPYASMGGYEVIGGDRVFVIKAGKGPALVMVHGSQMNAYDWRRNIETLSERFTVYAPDMPGNGLSDKPDAAYDPRYYANFLEALLDHYGLKKASLAASSWGGAHALLFALDHPERVDHLVLSSPCGISHPSSAMDRILAMPIAGNLLAMCGNRNLVRASLIEAMENPRDATEDLVDSVYAPLFMPGGLRAVARSYRSADFSIVASRLEAIDIPALIVWGDRDRFHSLEMMEEMALRMPNAELVIVPAAGHLPHAEYSEAFNEAAIAFLDE